MEKYRPFRMWWLAVLTLAAVLPRLPLMQAGFAIDDPLYVQFAGESDGLVSGVLDPWPIGYYRPLVSQYFEICQRVFGEWAPGYHLVSIACHVVVVWLVFLLCSRVAGVGLPALYGALAFSTLPVLNEAIAWAASIGDLLATGFVVASVLLAVSATGSKPRVEGWLWAASLAAMVLAMAAKEAAIVAVVLVPLSAWLFGRRRPVWGWTVAYPAVAVASASWYATRVAGPGFAAYLSGNPWRCLSTTVQKLMVALVPFGQNAVGDFLWRGQGAGKFVTVAGLVGLAVVVALAVRHSDRVSIFGWLWAFASFLPVCRLPWGDRYAYLPAVGLALVATVLLARLRKRNAPAATTATILVLVVFTLGSLLAAARWTLHVGRFAASPQKRSSIAAQWKPAPKAVSSTRSPGLTRPC